MVVDDSPTMRALVSFSLAGYDLSEIREAGNGLEALEGLAEKGVDLMVVDINMPEMNGIELIKSVRRDSTIASIPIVVLTTEGSDDDIRRGLEAGATEYLVKPFQPLKLHAVIDRIFGVKPVNA
jgi:two-component system chemotaxis response regulator CheY